MPRSEQAIVVLVASPSDLEPERTQLEQVIRELNLSWSKTLGLRFELVRWETHGYPGVGHDPQDVLNQELPSDPDIFIGLMWCRYGTATDRAGSGTEEEFNRALERYRQDPESIRIMFYFKDAPLSPSDIDSDQLRRVEHFRKSLGAEGALYWTFRTVEDFERLLRMHLSRQMQQFAELDKPQHAAVSVVITQSTATENEELGLLDFLDSVDEHFGTLIEIVNRMNVETASVGEKMLSHASEIKVSSARAQGQLNRREVRSLLKNAAVDMMQYVASMKTEIPLFRDNLQKGADAASQAVLISAGMDPTETSSASDARQNLVKFLDSLSSSYNAVESFKNTVQEIPRMTAVLNNAKRETAMVLQDQLDSVAEGRRIVTETIRTLDAILGNRPATSA